MKNRRFGLICCLGIIGYALVLVFIDYHATFGQAQQLAVGSSKSVFAVGNGSAVAVVNDPCLPSSLLAAIAAAREFVPTDSRSIPDVPLFWDGGVFAWGSFVSSTLRSPSGTHTQTSPDTPQSLRERADHLEKAEADRKATIKRQREAVDTFNRVYGQCVQPQTGKYGEEK